MNYKNLYNYMLNEVVQPLPIDKPPCGHVCYRLKHNKRATIESLGLTYDHQSKSPTFHFINNNIIVSKGFTNICINSTFYCAWMEHRPDIVIFWEIDNSFESITYEIRKERFRILSNFIFTISISNKDQIIPIVDHDISHRECVEDTNVEIDMLNKLNLSNKHVHDPDESILDTKTQYLESVLNFNEFIYENNDNCMQLIDDDNEYDPTGSISNIRKLFQKLCSFGDAVIAIHQYSWCNMNKTILNEFKAEWEDVITNVRDKDIDGLFPDSQWIEMMWFYVIGCPLSVRTKQDFIFTIRSSLFNSNSYDKQIIRNQLEGEGFRESLAIWISERCFVKTFKEDIMKLAKNLSCNSYLCSVEGKVHFTHLHKNGEEFEAVLPQKIQLGVFGKDLRKEIYPMEIKMEETNWFPRDFARKTFEYMKTYIKEGHYFLGHCCSEQSIVNMAKNGLSPYATYNNSNSCGHGMYFFRMDYDTVQLSFDNINNLYQYEKENIKGIQFRSFLYALSRVFVSAQCDSLSPSVLLILVKSDLDSLFPYDAVNFKLPICGISANWVCSECPRLTRDFSIQSAVVELIPGRSFVASDVSIAISLISNDDVEKFNSYSILGGVVDYQRIQNGIYTAIVTDNNATQVTSSLKNMHNWNREKEFKKWKNLVELNASSLRRPITFFNDFGSFSAIRVQTLNKRSREDWDICNYDPITEIVFVTSESLFELLEKSTEIYSVFLSPDDSFTQRNSDCHFEDTNCDAYSELIALNSDDRHLHWKLKSYCKQNRCQISE